MNVLIAAGPESTTVVIITVQKFSGPAARPIGQHRMVVPLNRLQGTYRRLLLAKATILSVTKCPQSSQQPAHHLPTPGLSSLASTPDPAGQHHHQLLAAIDEGVTEAATAAEPPSPASQSIANLGKETTAEIPVPDNQAATVMATAGATAGVAAPEPPPASQSIANLGKEATVEIPVPDNQAATVMATAGATAGVAAPEPPLASQSIATLGKEATAEIPVPDNQAATVMATAGVAAPEPPLASQSIANLGKEATVEIPVPDNQAATVMAAAGVAAPEPPLASQSIANLGRQETGAKPSLGDGVIVLLLALLGVLAVVSFQLGRLALSRRPGGYSSPMHPTEQSTTLPSLQGDPSKTLKDLDALALP